MQYNNPSNTIYQLVIQFDSRLCGARQCMRSDVCNGLCDNLDGSINVMFCGVSVDESVVCQVGAAYKCALGLLYLPIESRKVLSAVAESKPIAASVLLIET
jgi:hypothetical protein